MNAFIGREDDAHGGNRIFHVIVQIDVFTDGVDGKLLLAVTEAIMVQFVIQADDFIGFSRGRVIATSAH